MFKDVGKKLKSWAELFVILVTFLGFVVGCVIVEGEDDFRAVLIPIITAVIAFVFSYLSAILLYAFGELVDCVKELNEKIEPKKALTDQSTAQATPAQTQSAYNSHPNQVPAPKPPMPKKIDGWLCMRCGTKNKLDAKYCYKCGGSEKQ